MLADAREAAALRFSTRELPVRERMPMWREEFGQRMLHVEIKPLPDAHFMLKQRCICCAVCAPFRLRARPCACSARGQTLLMVMNPSA